MTTMADIEAGTVYIFRARGTDYFKFGYTKAPIKKRLAQAQTNCPYILVVYGYIETHDVVMTEAELMAAFAHYNVHGEWHQVEPHKIDKYLNENYDTIGA